MVLAIKKLVSRLGAVAANHVKGGALWLQASSTTPLWTDEDASALIVDPFARNQ
jgi:hypothetical protein